MTSAQPDLVFTVPGHPLPKQSYRASKHGGYTETRIKEWQGTVATAAWAARVQAMQYDPHTGPVKARLVFYRKGVRKVDCDNLSKCVMDGLEGVLFEDDEQVYDLRITRHYQAKEPRVIVALWLE